MTGRRGKVKGVESYSEMEEREVVLSEGTKVRNRKMNKGLGNKKAQVRPV